LMQHRHLCIAAAAAAPPPSVMHSCMDATIINGIACMWAYKAGAYVSLCHPHLASNNTLTLALCMAAV
jgi:diphthamide biosynthesis methyltransferase